MTFAYRRHLAWLLAIVVVLVLARLALPYVVRNYLNRHMDRMGDYHGQVDDVVPRGALREMTARLLRHMQGEAVPGKSA